jgi:ABC-2 type transport system ATP-binding protein
MNALEIKNFTKRYGDKVAVNNLSLTVRRGEFFGFLGPNGAGKSTTIHAMSGIATVTEGSISLFGIDVVHQYRDARKKIGLSPQEFSIDVFTTPRQVLDYVGGYYGMRKAERTKRIHYLLSKFELMEHADKEFRMLSGGLKRRVAIARAMIHDPDLLILDEPTAGVDVELRRDLWRMLRDLNKGGKTIILTSHYLEEVELLCGRIAIINKGEIVALGDKDDFIKNGRKLEDEYIRITQEKM